MEEVGRKNVEGRGKGGKEEEEELLWLYGKVLCLVHHFSSQ